MKKTLLTALMMLGAGAVVYGQATLGSIQWGNSFTSSNFRSVVYGPDTNGNPNASHVGQSGNGLEIPTGTTVYNGALLTGAGYTFAFFAGPSGSASNTLSLYGSTSFRTGGGAGLVVGATATLSNVNAGQQATFQIRVWNNQGGTITTWAAAEAAWLAGTTDASVTPLVLSAPLGGTDSNNVSVVPPVSSGWVSFNSYTVPEPTTMTLAGLGAAALMIFRRRK